MERNINTLRGIKGPNKNQNTKNKQNSGVFVTDPDVLKEINAAFKMCIIEARSRGGIGKIESRTRG
jgi:hypothetical protein